MLSAECVKVSVMQTWGLQGAGFEAPKAREAPNVLNQSFGIITELLHFFEKGPFNESKKMMSSKNFYFFRKMVKNTK